MGPGEYRPRIALLVPQDKGTALVVALVVAASLVALRRHGGPAAALVALIAVLVASAQGLAGEDGVPLVVGVVVVLAAVAAARNRDAYRSVVAASIVAALVLVQQAPANTSRVLSGGALHAGEARFLALGVVLLGVLAGVTAVVAWRRDDRPLVLGALGVAALGAVVHGVAFVGAVT